MEISWNKISDSEYSAKVGEYKFNIHFRPMISKMWVYNIRHFDWPIVVNAKPTLDEAKQAAENAYKNHVNK